MSEPVDTICNDLRLYLELVQPTGGKQAEESNKAKQVSKQQLQSAVELYKMEIAKMGFLLCQDEEPDAESFQNLLECVKSATFSLCCLFSSLALEAGVSLRSSLVIISKSIIDNTIAFVMATAGKQSPSTLKSAIPRLAGICFQSADAAMTMPLDNKTAIGRPLTRILKQIADATQEMAQESESSECEALPGFVAAQRCMEVVLKVMKAVARSLVASDLTLSTEEDVELWEMVLQGAKAVGNAVDDLGASSYDSDDVDEVKASICRLRDAVTLLVDTVPNPSVQGVCKAGMEAREVMDAVAAEGL